MNETYDGPVPSPWGDEAVLETRGRAAGVYFTADELLDTEFPEPRWAVPGLICEGLNLLVGSPKLGKSWLCLGLGVAIASGNKALDKIDVEQGSVLYAALEDTPRRLKNRLETVLDGDTAPKGLSITTVLPRGQEMVDVVSEWLDSHDDARLVIIDVLRKVTPRSDGRNSYEADYEAMGALKRLADKHRVAIVAVHHTRKMTDEGDVFNEVSGSTGLTGAADAILIAKRSRNDGAAALHVTGRDILENEYAITFDSNRCTWGLDGMELADAANKAKVLKASDGVGDRSAAIIRLLEKHPEGLGPTEVGRLLDLPQDQAKTYLKRLQDGGRIAKQQRGKYTSVTSVTSVTFAPIAEVIPLSSLAEGNTSNTSNTVTYGGATS